MKINEYTQRKIIRNEFDELKSVINKDMKLNDEANSRSIDLKIMLESGVYLTSLLSTVNLIKLSNLCTEYIITYYKNNKDDLCEDIENDVFEISTSVGIQEKGHIFKDKDTFYVLYILKGKN